MIFDEDKKQRVAQGAVVMLIAALGFALGYIFAGQTAIAPIIIEKCSQ